MLGQACGSAARARYRQREEKRAPDLGRRSEIRAAAQPTARTTVSTAMPASATTVVQAIADDVSRRSSPVACADEHAC